MMIGPEVYVEEFKNASHQEMMTERDRLIRYIQNFEKHEKVKDRSAEEWTERPNPVVRYQLYMDYLAALLKVMSNKYNEEYVWGNKKLSDLE